MFSKLLRTRAVMAMNSLSQEPQSRSMASLVRRVVVKGPGVRRMASRCMVNVSLVSKGFKKCIRSESKIIGDAKLAFVCLLAS